MKTLTKPLPSFDARGELLKSTTTRCPMCKRSLPGEVWKRPGQPPSVHLTRVCPEHGEFSTCLASDARFYWLAVGDRSEGCCGGKCCPAEGGLTGTLGRNAEAIPGAPFEKLSTCLALIEIVNSCNLSCPTCYADSPLGAGDRVDAVPLVQIQSRIEGVIARKGGIEILQLSGGEPTLHPQFFELIEWVQSHPKIDYMLVNTNGVRIARDAAFQDGLRAAAARRKFQIYLQFDGVQEAGQKALRGADLRGLREEAVAFCAAIDLPVTLAMTVTPENIPHVWEAIQFGLNQPVIHGITLQPMFGSGRKPVKSEEASKRLNAADVISAAVQGSSGVLSFEDFTPLPCGDPNCAIIGYLLRLEGKIRSVSEFLSFDQLQGFLKDKVQYTMSDLERCGCETEPLGAVLKALELKSSVAFRIMIKPFMDAWTWDQDRIDRCCTHVIRPDGKLDSFCRYYSGFPDTRVAP